MVVVQGLALLGEETIGLDAVLEAVELESRVSISRTGGELSAAPSSGVEWDAAAAARVVGCNSPPSKSLRSGNRPGRLDAYKVSINK